MRILIAGWFSFDRMGATAGDLMASEVACRWLHAAGHTFDVAYAPPFEGGIDWRQADPHDYSHILFVCGPCGNGGPLVELLERFRSCRLVGLDLSMLESVEVWNPFDLLWERDSSDAARPDISFASTRPLVPVVGLVLIHPQAEYGENDRHQRANDHLRRLAASREVAAIEIDTRLDENGTGLRTAAEVESLIARTDAVLTTRLHGTVLALKNGVPPLVIDPVAGGHKVSRQARTVGWPVVFDADEANERILQEAFEYCLTQEARELALRCRDRARNMLRPLREEFIDAISSASETISG